MRCSACQAFTRFVGIAWVPGTWIRYEICEPCEALFFRDEASLRGGRRSIDSADTPSGPPWATGPGTV